MATRYQKRHFQDMADILRTSKTKGEIRRKMTALFARENPNFDRGRFKTASMKARPKPKAKPKKRKARRKAKKRGKR